MSVARTPRRRAAATLALAATGSLLAAAPGMAAESEKAFGLLDNGTDMVTFQTDTPGTVSATIPITGLAAGQTVAGIDIQPRTGRLIAVSSDSKVYAVNKTTGVATQQGTTAFTPALSGARFGVDFNPVPNAIRVISDTGQNLRLNPDTGAATNDTALTGGTTPSGAAYTNSVNGANSTTLYVLDSGTDSLKRQGDIGATPLSPNGGVLTDIGALGLDFDTRAGFDISGATNTAYAALFEIGDLRSTFYTVNLANGLAQGTAPLIGIAVTPVVKDLAIDAQPPSVQFSAAAYSASEGAGTATVTITRTGNTDNPSTVSYAATAGTATAADFTAIPATSVSFAAGDTTKTFPVTLANDTDVESAETISLALTGPTGASLGAPNTATLTVFDNDPTTVTNTVDRPVDRPVLVPIPAPVPKDTAGPVFFLESPKGATLKQFNNPGLRLPFSCNETCKISLTLKIGKTTVGTATGSLTGASFNRMRLKLSTAGRRSLTKRLPSGRKKRSKRVSTTLSGTATDAAGNVTTVSKKISIRR